MKLTATEMIDSWVRDVAIRLPKSRRNDVAFELHALLQDELSARATAPGQSADPVLTMAVLREFGAPHEVARRYHEPTPVIDPIDTRHFVIWSVVGGVVLAVHGALHPLSADTGERLLQWLGVLLLGFAVRAAWRRRRPADFQWQPSPDPDRMPRGLAVLALVATMVFPLFMYAAPQTFVQTLFLGHFSGDAVALSEGFQHSWQRLLTLTCLLAQVVQYTGVAIAGRWHHWSHQIGHVSNGVLGLLLVGHSAPMAAWPGDTTYWVFAAEHANRIAAPIFASVGALILLSAVYAIWQYRSRVRPQPQPVLERSH